LSISEVSSPITVGTASTTVPNGYCILSGTPSAAGSVTLTVKATDSASNSASANIYFVVMTSSPITMSSPTYTSVSPTSETVAWSLSSPGTCRVRYSLGGALSWDTGEQSTSGTTSCSITLTGLASALNYATARISRGVSSGSPQDYLLVEQDDLGGSSFQTATAPTTGTPSFEFELFGPHNVYQGYGIFIEDQEWYIAGSADIRGTGNAYLVYSVNASSIPYAQVIWPECTGAIPNPSTQADCVLSTTNTANDTMKLSSVNIGTNQQIRLATNVGGTTPAGSYTITYTITAHTQSGLTVPVSHTWTVNVITPSFASGSPSTQPTLPLVSDWANNMSSGAAKWYGGGTDTCSFWADGPGFYDGQWVSYQAETYTGSSSPWETDAANCQTGYVENYLKPISYSPVAIYVFSHGVFRDCVTSDTANHADSCTAVEDLVGTNPPSCCNGTMIANQDSFAWAEMARESSWMLNTKRLDYDMGSLGGTSLTFVQFMVDFVLGNVDQYVNWTANNNNTTPGPNSTDYLRESFMAGLMCQSLIEYYLDPNTGNRQDPRIPDECKKLADVLWSQNWAPWNGSNGNWLYENEYALSGAGTKDYTSDTEVYSGQQSINLLTAPLYAFLYKYTGLTQYQLEGDTAWYGGVKDADQNGFYYGKTFTQNYRWSFDYVRWRGQTTDCFLLAGSASAGSGTPTNCSIDTGNNSAGGTVSGVTLSGVVKH
jgi:hypothetical protein